MNYWQGDNICIRAMEESDADFFYETLQDMDIQKNESDIRVPMSHKALKCYTNVVTVVANKI